MPIDRKETYSKSTAKRRNQMVSLGKKRLDTYVDENTLSKIDELKGELKFNTRGEVVDFILRDKSKNDTRVSK